MKQQRFCQPMIGGLFLFCSILAAVCSNGLIHFLGGTYPTEMMLFYKSIVGCIILGILFLGRLEKILIIRNVPALLVRTIIGIIGVFLWIRSLQNIPIGPASILALTSSFFSALGGYFFLKEKVSWQKNLGMVLGFSGAALIISPHFTANNWGYFLPLFSALCFGISATLTRYLSAQESEWAISFYLFSIMALCALPFGAHMPHSIRDFLILFLIGLLYALSQMLFVRAYKYAEASYLATFKFIKPPLHMFIGYLCFCESIEHLDFVGFMLIACAIQLITLWKTRTR